MNSALLTGELTHAVRRLKDTQDKPIVVFGSGVLLQSLMQSNLVDEYVLLIHPLVLGSGHRLFTDGGAFASLRLLTSKTTSKGVIIARYESTHQDTV
jgi:dihydrofolate reductase